jgi:hypothetical protein
MPDLLGSFDASPRSLGFLLKFAVAVLGTGLLLWRAWPVRNGASDLRHRRVDAVLGIVGLLAFASWWPLPYPKSIHEHEFFHYYLGAKYSPELGYVWLYDCVAAAEAETAPTPALFTRWTRDLRTNRMEKGSPAARNPALCRSLFEPNRWEEFKHDVSWFRTQATAAQWRRMQGDHGYNATPVWNAAGYMLANTGPVSKPKTILLALLDPVLLVVMWGVVWWAFGWRAATVAVLWWGTNYPARYGYIGGAFLRSDWLVVTVIGLAFARKGYMVLSGAALAWGTLLRVFPGFIAVGAVLSLLSSRDWRGASGRDALRLAGGALLAAAVLIPVSLLPDGGSVERGIARWSGFFENSRKHLSGTATNRVSLKTIVSYSPSNRAVDLRAYWIEGPGDAWLAARGRLFEERKILYWVIVAAFLGLLAFAVRGQPYWVALVLSVGLIPMLADITCYYYGILLAYGFLWDRRPWVGVGLVALSAFSLMTIGMFSANEDRCAAISAAVVAYVFAVTARYAYTGADAAPDREVSTPVTEPLPAPAK